MPPPAGGGRGGGQDEGGRKRHSGSEERLRGRPAKRPGAKSRRKLVRSPRLLQCEPPSLMEAAMDETTAPPLARIADGAGAPGAGPGRPRRISPRRGCSATTRPAARFVPAPDFALQLDLLVGVERQKLRFAREPEPLRRRACRPTTSCSGACAAPARARWPRPRSWPSPPTTPTLKLVEIDRDDVAAPARRCSTSCAAGPSGSWCCATTSRSRRARRRPRR